MGWIVAEYGRQPWTVAGVLPTALSVSNLTFAEVAVTLTGFFLLYTALLVVEMGLMFKAIGKGPQEDVALTEAWMAQYESRLGPGGGGEMILFELVRSSSCASSGGC